MDFVQGEIFPLDTFAQHIRSYILKVAAMFSNLVFCFIFILLPQPLLWGFNNSGFWSDLQEEFEVLSNKTNLRWVYLQNWRPAKKKKGKIHGGQIVDFLPRWFLKASWLFSFKNSNESQYVHALFCLKFITTFWGKYFHFSDEEI